MPAQFSGKRLPNTAAAAFFARKLNLPSNEWSDLWREAHDKAFTVAGTLNDSGQKALEQIREAVRAAIEDGETIEEFKKRFDDIVAKTGWDYRGGRNFRTRAIFETNLRTSWAAGRFSQMQEIKSERPFWQYRHGGSAQPRPEHLAWDGLILHADHPWWRTHYPPNGFGCTCHVVCLSAREVDREWKKAGGKGNPPKLDAHSPGIVFERGPRGAKSNPRLWTPPDPTKDLVEVKVKGRGVVQVPRGIDPGWDYVPGKAALEAAKAQKAAQKAQEVKAEAKAEAKTEAPQTAPKAAFKTDSKAAQTPATPGTYKPSVQLGRGSARHKNLEAMISNKLKLLNTFALDGVDIDTERELIRQGGVRETVLPTGIRQYEINGRVYEAHPPKAPSTTWPLYPVSGQGLVTVSKGVALALKTISHVERGKASRQQLEALNKYNPADVAEAWRIWRALNGDKL